MGYTRLSQSKGNTTESNGGMFGGEGELGSVSSSTAIGRWGMTFNDDTNITISSPEATAEVVFPAAAAANFDAPLTVYFGCMPSAPERVGQKAVLTKAEVLGAVGGVDVTDDFAGPLLDTTTWELAAQYPDGVRILTEDAALWLGWTLPDGGFGLQSVSAISGTEWSPFSGATPLPAGSTKSVLIGQSDLPGADGGYWRMIQREFTKLQILLPGEMAAPGTPSGKTGTPDPQTQYTPFDIIVNAVADDWSLVSSATDTVTLSTTDQDALLPADATLVNGTVTLSVDLGTVGTQTITVSDVTNPAITPDTSSEITLNPQ